MKFLFDNCQHCFDNAATIWLHNKGPKVTTSYTRCDSCFRKLLAEIRISFRHYNISIQNYELPALELLL